MQQYLQLLRDIKEKGVYKPAARAGMPGSYSLFGYQYRHDLSKGFPLLTTKKMYFKGIVTELLWFLRGDTNVKYLIDNGCNIWNEDAYNFYVKLCKQWQESPIDFERFIANVKERKKHELYSFYTFGDCGLQYGHQWMNFGGLAKYQVQPKANVEKIGGSKHLLKSTWEQMMDRCYNIKSIGFKNYGAKGVFVCDDWFDFGTFANSVTTLEGWEEKEKDWDNWQLDKDFTGDGFSYSPETCKWVNRSTNMSSSVTKFTFYKESENYTETTNNLRKFGRRHGISHSNLSRVISGERKSADGFTLKNIECKYNGINQIDNLISQLKKIPESRRHIVIAWNPKDIDHLALHPCHALFQFNCRPVGDEIYERAGVMYDDYKGDKNVTKDELFQQGYPKYYLDCHLYQRSADSFLGVPFNLASYALLTHIIARAVNMIPGEFIHSFGDVHIYENHMEAVDEQLTREPKPLPSLLMDDAKIVKEIREYPRHFENLEITDFGVINYESDAKISAKLSTGLQ